MTDQGQISQIAELISAIGGLAWPAIVIGALWIGRYRLLELINSLIDKIKSSSELKLWAIELKGIQITAGGDVIKGDLSDIVVVDATEGDIAGRAKIYQDSRHLMLVHTIRPTSPPEYTGGKLLVDVSIYVFSHQNRGKLNDVRSVTYFLGRHFGRSQKGSKYKISNGNNQFALSVRSYGPFLCAAEIEFHDGSSATVSRYIDSEMAPAFRSAS